MFIKNKHRLRIALAALGAGWASVSWALQAVETPLSEMTTEQGLTASARASFGFLNGTAHETLYDSIGDGSRYKASELIWDMKNLLMGGAVLSVGIVDRVSVNAGYWAPFTRGSGQMDDYDWLLYQRGSPWTDWSLSDVDVTRGNCWDVNASLNVFKNRQFTLRGILGYKQNFWRWEDFGVRHVYSSDPFLPGGFRDDIGEDGGVNAINYEQEFRIPYFGGGLDWAFRQFSLAVYLIYSPLVEADAADDHLLRNLEFRETFRNGEFLGTGLRGSYRFVSGFFASAALDFQHTSEMIGDCVARSTETGETEKYSNSVGAENEAVMLSLSAGCAF